MSNVKSSPAVSAPIEQPTAVPGSIGSQSVLLPHHATVAGPPTATVGQ
jgi:hypothetical protein